MPDANTDFPSVLNLLSENAVRFVLIGGLAMIAHGSEYTTRDIDIAYARDNANIAALAGVLRQCQARMRGLPPELSTVVDERTLRNMTNLTLATSMGDVDILAEPEGIDSFEGLNKRAIVLEIFGSPVRVASLEDLLAMKRAANRPKDHLHITELLSVLKSKQK